VDGRSWGHCGAGAPGMFLTDDVRTTQGHPSPEVCARLTPEAHALEQNVAALRAAGRPACVSRRLHSGARQWGRRVSSPSQGSQAGGDTRSMTT